MSLDSYRIVREGEHWSLCLNGEQMAIFTDRGRASRAAAAAARMSRSRGRTVELHVEEPPAERASMPSLALVCGSRV